MDRFLTHEEDSAVWGESRRLADELRREVYAAMERWQPVKPSMPAWVQPGMLSASGSGPLEGHYMVHLGDGVDVMYGEYTADLRRRYTTQADFDRLLALAQQLRAENQKAYARYLELTHPSAPTTSALPPTPGILAVLLCLLLPLPALAAPDAGTPPPVAGTTKKRTVSKEEAKARETWGRLWCPDSEYLGWDAKHDLPLCAPIGTKG